MASMVPIGQAKEQNDMAAYLEDQNFKRFYITEVNKIAQELLDLQRTVAQEKAARNVMADQQGGLKQ